MTPLDVCFRYRCVPAAAQMRALSALTEVYGIRRLQFDESARTVRVEYDASRLSDDGVARLLRNAGLDVGEKLALA
jgi:hypothetical protein